MKIPIFVALDVDNFEEALTIANEVKDHVGGFKVGPRLLMRFGPQLVGQLAELGAVFVDNKYYDIPSTVLSAVRATFEAGASFVTVHASNGKDCLRQLAELEKEFNQIRPFKILAVTVLTSFEPSNKPVHWEDKELMDHVYDLASEVLESGLTGIVCSGHEVGNLKSKFPNAYFVTPGIRLPEDDSDDQKRVLTPGRAMKQGASALVVGRPIVAASSPKEASQRFAQAVAGL